MADRSSPATILGFEIAELERELAASLAACPPRQRFEVEALRARIDRLKAQAPVPVAKPAAAPRVSLR